MPVENDRARVRIVAPSLLILLGTFALMAGGGAYFARGDWHGVLGSSAPPG